MHFILNQQKIKDTEKILKVTWENEWEKRVSRDPYKIMIQLGMLI